MLSEINQKGIHYIIVIIAVFKGKMHQQGKKWKEKGKILLTLLVQVCKSTCENALIVSTGKHKAMMCQLYLK